MKHHLSCTSLLALLAAVPASAVPLTLFPLGDNITISDQNHSGTGWYGDREDNETEAHPFTLQGQEWDLEGMFMRGSILTLIGGYDFKNGVTNNNHNYRSGDVFIDLNGDAVFGHPINSGAGTGGTTTNLFGYDLVLDLNFDTLTFNLIDLSSGATLRRPTDVPSSNPWRYESGGTAVADWQNISFSYYADLSNEDVGMLGCMGNNKHYAISFDTSFLPWGNAIFHYTMECGNDNLMGAHNVPDGGSTVALLGATMLGFVAVRRRRATKAVSAS